MIGTIIAGAKTAKEIKKKLEDAGLQYIDLTEEYGYMNIRVPFIDGYYRIYKSGDSINTQVWRKVEFRYSGIPTFEPSGRRSI